MLEMILQIRQYPSTHISIEHVVDFCMLMMCVFTFCDAASFLLFLIPVFLLHLNLWMMLSIHRPNTEKRKRFTPRLNCHGAPWGVNQVMYSCSVWVRKWAAQPLKYRQTVSFCLGAWVMVCPRLPYSENTETKVLWLRHVWLDNIYIND